MTHSTGTGSKFKLTPTRLVAVAVGVGVLLLTGWPVAGMAVAAAVIFVPSVLGGGKAAKQLIAKAEVELVPPDTLLAVFSGTQTGSTGINLGPFIGALHLAFLVGVGVSVVGAIVSAMRGGHRLNEEVDQASAA